MDLEIFWKVNGILHFQMSVYQAATRSFCYIETYRQPDILACINLCAKLECYQHSPSIIHSLSKMKIMSRFFLKFFWRTVLFVGPLMYLSWTSGDVCHGFQSQGGSHACMLQIAMDSSDSPLVWHLLTSWWPAWQPSCSSSTYLHRTQDTALVEVEPESWFISLPSKKL